jgi:hypothetical protein
MVPHSRRDVLHVASAIAATGLAGCSGVTNTTDTPSPTEAVEGAPGSGGTPAGELPVFQLRATAAVPIATGERETETDVVSGERRPPRQQRHEIIDSKRAASTLRINERAGLTEAVERPGDALAAFLDETDFSAQTVVLESNAVADCFELRLCTVDWSDSSVETDYTRVLRAYDEPCATRRSAYESRLIRIPEALDGDAINSYSTGIGSSGRCHEQRAATAEATAGDSSGGADDGGAE